MTQQLHIVFEQEDENRRIVQVGLDKETVLSASHQDQALGQVRLYMAVDVAELSRLLSANRETVMTDVRTLIP